MRNVVQFMPANDDSGNVFIINWSHGYNWNYPLDGTYGDTIYRRERLMKLLDMRKYRSERHGVWYVDAPSCMSDAQCAAVLRAYCEGKTQRIMLNE